MATEGTDNIRTLLIHAAAFYSAFLLFFMLPEASSSTVGFNVAYTLFVVGFNFYFAARVYLYVIEALSNCSGFVRGLAGVSAFLAVAILNISLMFVFFMNSFSGSVPNWG